MIISGGRATVKLGGTYKEVANTSMLVEILDWIKKDDTWKEFFYATKDKNKKKKMLLNVSVMRTGQRIN